MTAIFYVPLIGLLTALCTVIVVLWRRRGYVPPAISAGQELPTGANHYEVTGPTKGSVHYAGPDIHWARRIRQEHPGSVCSVHKGRS